MQPGKQSLVQRMSYNYRHVRYVIEPQDWQGFTRQVPGMTSTEEVLAALRDRSVNQAIKAGMFLVRQSSGKSFEISFFCSTVTGLDAR